MSAASGAFDLVLPEEAGDGFAAHGFDVLEVCLVFDEVVCSEAVVALGAFCGVFFEVGDVAAGFEYGFGVDDGGVYLEDVLVAGEVAAPLGGDVAFEFGA